MGGTNRSHDSNGNVTDDGTYKFKYNYKNLICEVRLSSNNNLVAEYQYDANGRRVEKAVSGGVTERYIYSGFETVAVYDGSDNLKQKYVYGQGIDEITMMEQADILDYDGDQNTTEITRSFYHRNALGSVMEVTDMNQAKAVDYRYTPYGEITITRNGRLQSTDPLDQHWTYTGRFYDEESGLYYYRARAYDPKTGRFLQRDPLGTIAGPLLYDYAHSCPTVFTDPEGMDPPDPPVQRLEGAFGAGAQDPPRRYWRVVRRNVEVPGEWYQIPHGDPLPLPDPPPQPPPPPSDRPPATGGTGGGGGGSKEQRVTSDDGARG